MTAIWTAPRTWTAGEVVTAAMLNGHVRDNLEYLKTPVSAHFDDNASAFSTTSASFVDITGATGTITTTGGRVLVGAMLTVRQGGTAQNLPVTIVIDGVNQGDATNGMVRMFTSAGNYVPVSLVWFSEALTAASHTVKLQIRTPNANGINVDHVHFFVREVS